MPGDRGRRRWRASWIAALLLTGCVQEQIIAPGADQIVVHSILDPASREQFVLLERAQTGQPFDFDAESACDGRGTGVALADVAITTPDGAVMQAIENRLLHPTGCRPGLYHISLDQYGVSLQPGGTYALRVRTAAGGEITGTTTIPSVTVQAAATAPEPFDRERDTLRLSWAPASGAAGYEVLVQSGFASHSLFTQRDATLPGGLRDIDGGLVFFPGMRTTVVVSAVDANYYDYYRTPSDPFTGGGVINRLSGGVGVFGSLVVLTRRTLDVLPLAPAP